MSRFASLTEHRRHPRFDSDAAIQLFDKGAAVYEPRLVDLSVSGMGLQLYDEAVPGQRLAFALQLPAGAVRGQAVVRWARPHHLGWRCGVELDGLSWSDRRRLRFFLEPDATDWLKMADLLLVAGAALSAILVALDQLGLLNR